MTAQRIAYDSEAEEARGYIYTHADCPHCSEAVEVEGDATGDTIQCDACEGSFTLGQVF